VASQSTGDAAVVSSLLDSVSGRASQESLELAQQAKMSGAYGSMIAAVEALALTQTGPIAQNLNGIEEIAAAFQNSWTLLAILGYGYAVCDQTEKAWEILGRLRRTGERKRRECGYLLAIVLLGLGEKREAVSFLENRIPGVRCGAWASIRILSCCS